MVRIVVKKVCCGMTFCGSNCIENIRYHDGV
jgi:hypothetical protein